MNLTKRQTNTLEIGGNHDLGKLKRHIGTDRFEGRK